MKKTILTLLLIVVFSKIYSQEYYQVDVRTSHIVKYERVYEKGQFVSKVKDEKAFEVDYKMVIDLKSDKISVDNAAGTVFYVKSVETSNKGVDSDGDVFLKTIFKGVDEENIKCTGELIIYQKRPYVFFTIYYGDGSFSFLGFHSNKTDI